jgi:hypothetical protein
MFFQTHELQTKSKNLAELETKLLSALARSGQVSNADISNTTTTFTDCFHLHRKRQLLNVYLEVPIRRLYRTSKQCYNIGFINCTVLCMYQMYCRTTVHVVQ